MIPESFLEELKYRSDIEQIVSPYTNLKRSGRNLTGSARFIRRRARPFLSIRRIIPFIASAAARAGISSPLSAGPSTSNTLRRSNSSPTGRV